MTREKMTEILSETICVTPEDARAALEASDWNALDAAQRLQRARARAARAEAGRAAAHDDGWRIGDAFRDLTARLSRGRLAATPR